MLKIWRQLPLRKQWLLFIPVTAFLVIVTGITGGYLSSIISEPESALRDLLNLLNSALMTVVVFWGVINLIPRAQQLAAWIFFLLLSAYTLSSAVSSLNGNSLFSDEVTTAMSIYWILQIVQWFAVAPLAILFFLRKRSPRHDDTQP